jgi:hypothetical protein
MRYEREDFWPVRGVTDRFYCPACNASPEDDAFPPCGELASGGVCGTYGTGKGSLDSAGVERYLNTIVIELDA